MYLQHDEVPVTFKNMCQIVLIAAIQIVGLGEEVHVAGQQDPLI
jgi:hypothetical protein